MTEKYWALAGLDSNNSRVSTYYQGPSNRNDNTSSGLVGGLINGEASFRTAVIPFDASTYSDYDNLNFDDNFGGSNTGVLGNDKFPKYCRSVRVVIWRMSGYFGSSHSSISFNETNKDLAGNPAEEDFGTPPDDEVLTYKPFPNDFEVNDISITYRVRRAK